MEYPHVIFRWFGYIKFKSTLENFSELYFTKYVVDSPNTFPALKGSGRFFRRFINRNKVIAANVKGIMSRVLIWLCSPCTALCEARRTVSIPVSPRRF
jgi:hypothetical protein